MKKIEVLNKNIEILNLDSIILKKLNYINICKVEDLWKCKKEELKDNNFTNSDIAHIKVRLQLIGLDLNGKVY